MVSDIIDYTDDRNIDGVLLSLDYEKAFDTAEHAFLFEYLNVFNFGPDFRKWIQIMYTNSEVCIQNNGHLSEHFYPSRGVKQGCPISAMLFILIVEAFAISIRNNNNIEGIQIDYNGNKIDLKISQYADDTIIILTNMEMIKETLLEIDKFAQISGLKLNIGKTIGIRLGPNKDNIGTFNGIQITNEPIKYLGLFIGHDKIKCNNLNWDEKLLKAKKELLKWNCRYVTIWGKIVVLKTLIISKCIYLMMNTTPDKDVIKKLERMCFKFVWGNKDRIRRVITYSKISKGGLNMINPTTFCQSLKATWIKSLFFKRMG